MNGIIILNDEEEDFYKYSISYNGMDELYNYVISIDVKNGETFKDLISNVDELNEEIELTYRLLEDDDVPGIQIAEEEKKFFKDNIGKAKELFDNAKYVELIMPIDKAIQFIKNNPDLNSKKIIIRIDNNLDISLAQKIASNIKINDLSFRISGNEKTIDFKEYVNTIYAIDKIVQKVKRLELSPFETILYVYNLLKERTYSEVKDDDFANSRDLSKALLGKNIVCVGFTVIFNTILNQLGIDAKTSRLSPLKGKYGHQRSEIYVVDPKYNVNGAYYFDVTWDSKQNDDTLFSYKFFAKTKGEIDIYDKNRELYDESFPQYKNSIGMVMNFYNEFKKNGLKNIPKEMIKSLEHMYYVINNEVLFPGVMKLDGVDAKKYFDIEKKIDSMIETAELFNRPLCADTFLKVLYNVRKKECLYGEKERMYTKDELLKILIMSNWNFNNPIIALITEITGKTPTLTKDELIKDFDEFIDKSSFELEENNQKRK